MAGGVLFIGFESSLTLVSESGLYKLIMRSDKPIAATFQDWVTREVLPSIRKTGGYLLNEDMRSTAAADSRKEFPMPTSFSAAGGAKGWPKNWRPFIRYTKLLQEK